METIFQPPKSFYPFYKPKGVMNLRSMKKKESFWIDVDDQYLSQLELKEVISENKIH